jgi:hypothetical protein
MNSRRLICPPLARRWHRNGSNRQTGSGQVGAGQCALYPQKPDIGKRRLDVRFVPKADISRFIQSPSQRGQAAEAAWQGRGS